MFLNKIIPSLNGNGNKVNQNNFFQTKKQSNFLLESYRDLVRTFSNVVLTGCNTTAINDIGLGVSPDKSLGNNFHNTFMPWLIADFIIARTIKSFKKIPLLNLIPAEFINFGLITTIYPILKFTTKSKNSLTQLYSQKNKSPEEKIISEHMQNKPIAKFVESLSDIYKKHLEKFFTPIMKVLFGVGGKKVNYAHYLFSNAAILLASIFTLDKNEKSIGFEDAHTPLRSARAFITEVMSNITYGFISTIPNNLQGFNFHQALNNTLTRKIPYVLMHAAIDGIVNPLKNLPINPASLATILKFVAEVTMPIYNRALMHNVSDKIKVPEKADFIAHKLLKPIILNIEAVLSPIYEFTTRHFISKLGGMFAPDIPHMYDKSLLQKDLQCGLPEHLSEYKNKTWVETFEILVETLFSVPSYLYDMLSNSFKNN